MPAVIDPVSGLELYELSHRWGMYTPIFPGYEEIKLERITHHAKQGVMTHKITTIFHTSTHRERADPSGARRAGGRRSRAAKVFRHRRRASRSRRRNGSLIEPSDLERAKPQIKAGDIVLINTGWHRKYSDSKEYFGYAPGLSKHAAEWLVKKRVKLVGIDTACVDHPLATSLGPHRNGPQIKYLLPEYKEATGREAIKDFPEWNAAHRTLLEAGIPTIENVGGDLDALSGKRCTFQGFPWKWHEGDACVIRLVAMLDPKGTLPAGARRRTQGGRPQRNRRRSNRQRGAGGLQFFDLSHPLGPRHAAMAVARQSQRPGRRIPRQGRPSGAAVRRHHASRHPHGRADPCGRRTADADRLSAVALLRHRRRGFDPERQVGRRSRRRIWRSAEPKIQKNDIVMINTGSHKNYGDNPDYFAYSPGLYKEAAEWLVERGVKLVGIDVQALDHPLGTFLGPHGPGPAQPHLDVEYKAETGRHIIEDFPYWEPAHKIMMTNGIPGIENIGGDIDKITGQRCTFFAFPWRWPEGEGCALRVVAVLDPKQAFRFETGR